MEASLRVCGERARNKQDSYNLISRNGIRAHILCTHSKKKPKLQEELKFKMAEHAKAEFNLLKSEHKCFSEL